MPWQRSEIPFKDTEGREREPFVFKNTQFLSVRASYLGLFQPSLPGVWDQQIGLRW